MHRLKYRFGSFAGEGRPCIRASRKWTGTPDGNEDMEGREHDSLSDSLARDSRGFRALAYITICVDDSTSRKQARRTGRTE